MGYSKILKELFKEITLNVDDLFVLESFQIKHLPDRVLQKEFSTLLRAYPYIQKFLITKYPKIEGFINSILKKNKAINDKDIIDEYCIEALWEIADLIIYNKYPGIFDTKVSFNWKLDEIISAKSLEGKVVADVGAGSGMLTFLVAKYAKTVYAVEPITNFRSFIREKTIKEKHNNIYVIDGFLDSIPLPDNSIDILMTSNAIGWNLEQELQEIERVVKVNGNAIHLLRSLKKDGDNPFHDNLLAAKWGYQQTIFSDDNKFKYWKNF